jgi:quercetin dioxygenase-like cupin family protein
LEGNGALATEEGDKKFKAGDAVYVAPNEKHQFKNADSRTLKFLCMVPHKRE